MEQWLASRAGTQLRDLREEYASALFAVNGASSAVTAIILVPSGQSPAEDWLPPYKELASPGPSPVTGHSSSDHIRTG